MDERQESAAAEISKRLEAVWTDITREAIGKTSVPILMTGISIFYVQAIIWCHAQMHGTPENMEVVIQQVTEVLRRAAQTGMFQEGPYHVC